VGADANGGSCSSKLDEAKFAKKWDCKTRPTSKRIDNGTVGTSDRDRTCRPVAQVPHNHYSSIKRTVTNKLDDRNIYGNLIALRASTSPSEPGRPEAPQRTKRISPANYGEARLCWPLTARNIQLTCALGRSARPALHLASRCSGCTASCSFRSTTRTFSRPPSDAPRSLSFGRVCQHQGYRGRGSGDSARSSTAVQFRWGRRRECKLQRQGGSQMGDCKS
jgi:hypothetical protein